MMDKSLRTGDYIMDVVKLYSNMLIRVSYTYVKNTHDAEDIAHDVFLKLLEKQPAFESEEHRKAWLIRTAINMSKNKLKTAWFRKTQPLEDNIYSFTSEENYVLNVILELPQMYKSVIYLFYVEGYSISEMAAILNRKESTVGSQLHRARKLLKSKLEEDFDV